MSCDPQTLLAALRLVTDGEPFTFVSEWLGYLPFGQYCWIEIDGVDVASELPAFDSADLARLVADGSIVELERHVLNETDSRTVYQVQIPS